MNKTTSHTIIKTLRSMIPNPVCELDYQNVFELLCAVILSAQTTDKRVNTVTKELFAKFPDCDALENAPYETVLEIIRPVGLAPSKARNLIRMAKQLKEEFSGIVPKTREELERLPGVGRKTASVVLAVGYQIPAMPVDTHLHRVAIRLGYAPAVADVKQVEEQLCRYIPKEDWIEAHHLLLLFGRYHCKAIHPQCEDCRLKPYCRKK